MDALGLLQELSEAFGPSGHEDDVRDLVLQRIDGLADEVRTDNFGNVIATRKGKRDEVLLLDAHMDEVGFLVSYVDPAGFLRLFPLGGWDARILPSHAVTVRGTSPVRGVIGTVPPHVLTDEDRKQPHTLDGLFVDIGARSADEVDDLGVRVGSPVVPSYGFEHLSDDLVMGKAFDDRAGCTILIRALEELRNDDLELTTTFAFTTQEERGLIGARVAANQAGATIALALEATTATDVPGVDETKRLAVMGAGPAVSIADRSALADRGVVALLERVGDEQHIPYHRKLPGGGGTDAAAIQTAGGGVRCGVLSVPCRYIHTPLSLLRPSDLDASILLATAFTRAAGELVA